MDTDPVAAPPPAPARRRAGRDRTVFLSVVLISLLLVGTLWAVARGAPSSVQQESVVLPTPRISADQGCAQFARYWTADAGVSVPLEAIARVGNCRLSAAGEWFVPDGPNDPRLGDGFGLTSEEAEGTRGVRRLIERDLEALQDAMPNSLSQQLQRNYDERERAVVGHTKWGVERRNFGVFRARYTRLVQAFLIDPERIWLADYVGWRMSQRLNAATQFEAACAADPDMQFLERACRGMREDLAVELIPLPWELEDPVLLEEYLAELARSERQLPAPVATLEPTSLD